MKKKMSMMMLCMAAAAVIAGSQTASVQAAKPAFTAKTVTLVKGQTKTVKVKNKTKRAKITFTVKNKKIAKITKKYSSSLKLKGLKKGKTTLSAKVKTGAKVKNLTCTVKVESPALSKKTLSMKEGKTYILKLNGNTQKVTWTSSKKSVATVSKSGKVTAKKAGQATITASIPGRKYTCKLTVTEAQTENNSDTDWNQYIREVLVPRYGIMSTDSWKLDNSLRTWSKGDDSPADGILSALIEDFDRDGDDELLVVRFKKEDNKKLYLEVFENYDGAVGLATGAKFDIDWLCRTCQNNRFSVFAKKKDGKCRIYLYAFQRGNGGGEESLVQLEYEQVMIPQITLERYWSFMMGSDGTASVQSGTLKRKEINQVHGLWDYGQGTDQAETDYEETAGAPYESDSYPEAFIGMLEDFYGNLEETTGLVHKSKLPHYFGDDSIGIYVSADDGYSEKMLYTAKNLFEKDSNTIWIASLDNHMYFDLSSHTTENTMIPQDYTGIVR